MHKVIDVHSHILPAVYVDEMRKAGLFRNGNPFADGMPFPNWSLDDSLSVMDRNGISTSVLSVTAPGVQFLPVENGQRLSRSMNDKMLQIVHDYPGRFACLAVLPLSDIKSSIYETEYALSNGADGIGLYSNVDGLYLGNDYFKPLFEELDRQGATVFIHPAKSPSADDLGIDLPAPILEYPFDTTRTLTSLLFSGTLARYQNVKFIVPHGGGSLPYLAARVGGASVRFGGIGTSNEAIELLRTVYYDLTAMGQISNLAMLSDFVPADRILVGYDYPFRPESAIHSHVLVFDAYDGFSDDEKEKIRRTNALHIFPRLKKLETEAKTIGLSKILE